jgi:hypothetical protein
VFVGLALLVVLGTFLSVIASVIYARSNTVVVGQYAKVRSSHLCDLIGAMPIKDVGYQKSKIRCVYRGEDGTRPDESHGPGNETLPP